MFDKKLFKKNGLATYKANIWLCIIASLIATIITGAGEKIEYKSESTQTVNEFFGTLEAIPVVGVLAKIVSVLTVSLIAAICICVAILFGIFVVNTIKVGICKFYLEAREGNYDLNNLLFPIKSGCFSNIIVTMIIHSLTLALFYCLLVIPGIIKTFELYYVPYIMAENPDMEWREAFALSKELTNGHKGHIFGMYCSFILLYILNGITGGLAQLFTQPYIDASFAESYVALSTTNNDPLEMEF